jgi:hypothetical protein
MLVQCYDSKFEVPDLLISQFVSDFDGLPGSRYREGVYEIRETIYEIVDLASEDPDILHEPEYHVDFIRALAMKQAMENLGIYYDS